MKSLADSFKLNNGQEIPCIGLGTWLIQDGKAAVEAILQAISCGYRHIDTAAIYGNEASVGKALTASGIPREQLFVTSKVWTTERGYNKTLAAFEKTMAALQLDYLDLYLIHWPAAKGPEETWQKINLETWQALEYLYQQKRIKAIGVSNFLPHHLMPLMEAAAIKPMVNQIEFHPGQMQWEAVSFCQKNNIQVEAWSPLGKGKILDHPLLIQIAGKYGKSVAQLCIRWCLQHEVLPIPKSVNKARMLENSAVFDFSISAEDMVSIDAMPYAGGSGLHPDEVNF